VFQSAAGNLEGAARGRHRTAVAPGRTGLLSAQPVGLLGGGLFACASGPAAGRGRGDLLQLSPIDLPARSLVAEGAADDACTPVHGGFGDAGPSVGSQLPCTPEEIPLEVRIRRRDELPTAILGLALCRAKCVLHSW
jgi:hypothetical protein